MEFNQSNGLYSTDVCRLITCSVILFAIIIIFNEIPFLWALGLKWFGVLSITRFCDALVARFRRPWACIWHFRVYGSGSDDNGSIGPCDFLISSVFVS